jgi:hypothetical protein
MAEKFLWSGQKLSVDELTSIAGDLNTHANYNTALFTHNLYIFIIAHFLGFDWYKRYCSLECEANSYLAPKFRNDGRAAIYSMRMLNLAEMLFNLQSVEGFEHPLGQLANGQIESGLAEMQLGMMLYQAHHKLRYIDPNIRPGKIHDIELDFSNGSTSCADIKCKKDSTDLSVETISNSLGEARKQLPKGCDGIVFVKVPQAWAATNGSEIFLAKPIIDASLAFFRGTDRVALIVFYLFHLTEIEGGIRNRHAIRELPSPKRFHQCAWGENLFPFDLPIKWISISDLVGRWSENR